MHGHGEYKRSQRAKARGIRRALHQRALNVRAWLLRALRAMQPHDMREDGGEYVCVDCSY